MNTALTYLWIALGGALGSAARFFCAEWIVTRWPGAFPLGTLFVNVLGSAIIGMAAALGESDSRVQLPLLIRQFIMIGVLGGYTTFSSFSLQTVMLIRNGAWLLAAVNAAASVFLCVLAAWAGFAVISSLLRV
jgi:CrcB protein